jgi:outer membrane biosynthesis protein TonB
MVRARGVLAFCFGAMLASSALAPAQSPSPSASHKDGAGWAIYEVHLKPDRTVSKIIVLQSSGSPLKDELGANELKTWRFAKAPLSVNVVKVPMTFKGL